MRCSLFDGGSMQRTIVQFSVECTTAARSDVQREEEKSEKKVASLQHLSSRGLLFTGDFLFYFYATTNLTHLPICPASLLTR